MLGLSFEQLVNVRLEDLGRYLRAMPGERRAVTLAGSGRVLFLHAVPPPGRWPSSAPVVVPEARVPTPLAALSGGDPSRYGSTYRDPLGAVFGGG